jgi:CBS domain-containing protein
MLVSMWMTRGVAVIPATMTIADAAAEMSCRDVRRLPVVEPGLGGPRLVGIVSLIDLVRAFPADVNPLSPVAADRGPRQPVAGIMTRDPLTIAPDAPLEEAARMMLEHRIGGLPVVRDGAIVGILTESDIFRALVETIASSVPTVRVTFVLSEGEDVASFLAGLGRRPDLGVVSALTFDHEGRRLGVIRMTGPGAEPFVEDLWDSGHQVLSVLRIGLPPDESEPPA